MTALAEQPDATAPAPSEATDASRPAPAPSRRRRVAARVGDALMAVAAAGGVVCVLLVVAAVSLHVTLIMFKTGSMAPTIPAGSLAVVRQIPASQIHVGEVVTVDRPGELPVSHRVVSVTGTGAQRTIVLKGDANQEPDVSPYTVTHVRRVVWSAPGAARAVVWVARPQVMGVVVLAVAALVTWSFWPRRRDAS